MTPQEPADGLERRTVLLIATLRPHQWVKNLLVFVPLLAAHRLLEGDAVLRTLAVFLAMCLAASSVYVLNDLLDIDADRRHPTKRRRPFASGQLPTAAALPLMVAAGASAAIVAWSLSVAVLAAIATYILGGVAYAMYFKRRALVDALALAGLYTIRIVAGHVAVDVPFSPWLLAFSTFVFGSLAFAKRYSELHAIAGGGADVAFGRGYTANDLVFVEICGLASAFTASLVLALYVASDATRQLYRAPLWLWFLSPLVLVWTCRVWLITHRGQMHEDPVVFALRDPFSYALAASAAVILYVAS